MEPGNEPETEAELYQPGKEAKHFLELTASCDAPVKWFRVDLMRDISSQVETALKLHRLGSLVPTSHERATLNALSKWKGKGVADVVIVLDSRVQVKIFLNKPKM